MRTYPVLLERLETGALTLTAIGLLAPHLTLDNHHRLIDAARDRTKREIEQLVATLRPQPHVPSLIRKVPVPTLSPVRLEAARSADGSTSPVTSRPTAPTALASDGQAHQITHAHNSAVVRPLDAAHYRVQCTITRDAYDKLRRIQDLTRHTNPQGDLGIVLERAVTMLLEHLERTKLAQVSRPKPSRNVTTGSRHIPATTRRAVWVRDGGQCAFVGTQGRCTERGFLEFHHVQPFADGGTAALENIQLRCRAHNKYESDLWFPLDSGGESGSDTLPVRTRSGPS